MTFRLDIRKAGVWFSGRPHASLANVLDHRGFLFIYRKKKNTYFQNAISDSMEEKYQI